MLPNLDGQLDSVLDLILDAGRPGGYQTDRVLFPFLS